MTRGYVTAARCAPRRRDSTMAAASFSFGSAALGNAGGFGFGQNPATTTAAHTAGFGGFGNTAAPMFGGFGIPTSCAVAPASVNQGFGGFGTLTMAQSGANTAVSTVGVNPGAAGVCGQQPGAGFNFGGFATNFPPPTSTAASQPGTGFCFGGPRPTGMFGGFGGFGNLGAGTGGLAAGTGALGGGSVGPFGGFSAMGAQQSQQVAGAPVYNLATALSAPCVFSDERDAIIARWNQLQAFWGTGRGYFLQNAPCLEFTLQNPFCHFKAVGYSLGTLHADEEGLVTMVLARPVHEVQEKQALVLEVLLRAVGGGGSAGNLQPGLESIKAVHQGQTEVVVYVTERVPGGGARRVHASTLCTALEQLSVRPMLDQQLSVTLLAPRVALSQAQMQQHLRTPPAGIDPIIWEQAKIDNPDREKLIPVPMVGFKELHQRLKSQEEMTKLHQSRLEIIGEDILELKKLQTSTLAKSQQYKRKQLELSHRLLQVVTKQEVMRKSGCAIQSDEEQLRVTLESLQGDLNAPTQYKGRLNELMSQVRMQSHCGVARSDDKYSVEPGLLMEIKQHLRQQQEGLSHLISIIRDDMDDLKTIERGLSDASHTLSHTRKH
ncbi:LOW QUALITY PROTEIN: nucleoporin p54 [Lethenteron reissneri]|uniref:LOW QUALITY PROTEIN: nucleoporin p54 n=1 Tax=Lethenteron reissneri TaxID=7753 RepID=UPI002AB78C7B|nr:LOW QUALITY PROTEIN: nucleoporin p54 [Lethenteron reissneri]